MTRELGSLTAQTKNLKPTESYEWLTSKDDTFFKSNHPPDGPGCEETEPDAAPIDPPDNQGGGSLGGDSITDSD